MPVFVALLTPAQVRCLADYGYTTMDAPFGDEQQLMVLKTLDDWSQMIVCLNEEYDITRNGQDFTDEQQDKAKHIIKEEVIGVDWTACSPKYNRSPTIYVTDGSFAYLNSFQGTPRKVRIDPLDEIQHYVGKKAFVKNECGSSCIKVFLCGPDPDIEDSPYYVRILPLSGEL